MAKAKPAWSKDMIVPAQSARRVVKGQFGRFSDPAPPEIEADPWMRLAWYAPHEALRQMEKWKCEQLDGGLIHFIRLMWHIVEPERPLVEGWVLHAICEHLEAVSKGKINRLLINVPPGSTKSLTADVFWPAWEWGPLNRPSLRYMCASYTSDLTRRDNRRFRSLVTSDLFMNYWGKNVIVDGLNEIRVGNDKTGWKLATSVGGTGTGERADRVILDDANNPLESESPTIMRNTEIWFREVIPDRLNSLDDSAIINIQQRTNEGDVSGIILENELPYVHLMIPMEYDPTRFYVNEIGWKDPRGLDEYGDVLPEAELQAQAGALAWPERFSASALADLSRAKGEYAWNGQYQQSPAPRGGGIFKRAWLEPWPPTNEDGEIPLGSIVNTYDGRPATQADYDRQQAKILYPALEYIVGSVDTAHTAREENDFCAMVVLGVFRAEGQGRIERQQNPETGQIQYVRIADDVGFSKVLLLHGWMKRLTLHGPPEQIPSGVDLKTWNSPRYLPERQKTWGLVEWTHWTATKYKIDHLIIETQAVGHALDDELHRLHSDSVWSVELKPALGDKIARGYRVQGLLSSGQVYVPTYPDGTYPTWCTPIVDQLCMAAGTPIITKHGVKNIEDIENGDLVLTHGGRFRPVLAVGERVVTRLITLEPKTLDPITLTPEHPVYSSFMRHDTWGGGRRAEAPDWIASEKLQARGYSEVTRRGRVMLEANQHQPAHTCLLPVARAEKQICELDLREWALLPTGKKYEFHSDETDMWTAGRIKSVHWRQSLDLAFGRICGLYLAEGTSRRQQTRWCFSEKETEYVDEVRSFIKDRFGVGSFVEYRSGGAIVVANLPLLEGFFAEFGKSAETKCPPEWVWDAPDEFISGLVSGYADGDGHREPRDNAVICGTVSRSLAWAIRLLGARIGIRATIHTRPGNTGGLIKGRAIKSAQMVYILRWVETNGLLSSHFDIEDDYIAYSIMKKADSSCSETMVYNLHVAEDESYCTTGGIVHNCVFPKGKHDDSVDTITQGLAHLRDIGIFERKGEYDSALAESLVWKPSQGRITLPYEL